ncbi:MAG: hypothetical protein HQK96_18765 [Nitrospirae bacterium]|nr:hypothetical protein [Nitrospirota bacterium]
MCEKELIVNTAKDLMVALIQKHTNTVKPNDQQTGIDIEDFGSKFKSLLTNVSDAIKALKP